MTDTTQTKSPLAAVWDVSRTEEAFQMKLIRAVVIISVIHAIVALASLFFLT